MQLEADATPSAAALEHEQVAAVGVDVHQVRVQRAHRSTRGRASARVRHGTSPQCCRGARRSRRSPARRRGAARPPRLVLELGDARPARARSRRARRGSPTRARASPPSRRSAFAFDQRGPVDALVRSVGAAEEQGTARVRALRRRPGIAGVAVERFELVTIATASRPPGACACVHASGRRRPVAPPSSWNGLHRHQAEGEVLAVQLERARVGADRLDRSAGGALPGPRAAPRRGRAPSRGGRRARASSATRPVPAPTSRTGRPPPEPRARAPATAEIGAVGAALEIVPDHLARSRTPCVARLAACHQQLSQREHRGVGRQRVQGARLAGGRQRPRECARARSSRTWMRAGSTPGVLQPRGQIGARVPLHVTRLMRPRAARSPRPRSRRRRGRRRCGR